MEESIVDIAEYLFTALREFEPLCADRPQLQTIAYLLSMTRLEAARVCNPDKDIATLFADLKTADAKARTKPPSLPRKSSDLS
jgi:hypothetical protein